MELRCPSCGVNHKSEDYPGAFEIQCSCGYSILLPDENIATPDTQEPNFNDIPAAMEVEDDELRLSLEKKLADSSTDSADSISDALTPSEELPTGMVYDPFEVEQLDPGLEETEQNEDDLQNDLNSFMEESSENSDSSEAIDEFSDSNENIIDEFSETSANDENEELSTDEHIEPPHEHSEEVGQQLVTRTQLAAVGQLVGPSYDLAWADLNKSQMLEVKEKLLEHLKKWPWLNEELEKRNIQLQNIDKLEKIDNVPELIAVQLYMLCFEMGGKCDFKLHNI